MVIESVILVSRYYGAPSNLEYRTEHYNQLAPDHVRIRLKMAGIEKQDIKRLLQPKQGAALPLTFGHDFAGEVLEIGKDVKGLLPRMAVLGYAPHSAHASVVDLPAHYIVPKPASLDWAIAANIAGPSLTTALLLEHLSAAQKILFIGPHTPIGHIFLQAAAQRGLKLYVPSDPRYFDHLQGLGAQPIGTTLRDALTHGPFDAMIDSTANKNWHDRALRLLSADAPAFSLPGKSYNPRVVAFAKSAALETALPIIKSIAEQDIRIPVVEVHPFTKSQHAYATVLRGAETGRWALEF